MLAYICRKSHTTTGHWLLEQRSREWPVVNTGLKGEVLSGAFTHGKWRRNDVLPSGPDFIFIPVAAWCT